MPKVPGSEIHTHRPRAPPPPPRLSKSFLRVCLFEQRGGQAPQVACWQIVRTYMYTWPGGRTLRGLMLHWCLMPRGAQLCGGLLIVCWVAGSLTYLHANNHFQHTTTTNTTTNKLIIILPILIIILTIIIIIIVYSKDHLEFLNKLLFGHLGSTQSERWRHFNLLEFLYIYGKYVRG